MFVSTWGIRGQVSHFVFLLAGGICPYQPRLNFCMQGIGRRIQELSHCVRRLCSGLFHSRNTKNLQRKMVLLSVLVQLVGTPA